MDYAALKKQTETGWNTFNSQSVLSHVLMPYGLAISLVLKDLSSETVLRQPKIGRKGESEEHITPGLRSYDGRYTELTVDYLETRFRVQSTSDGQDLILLITPEKQGRKTPILNVELSLLWGRDGLVGKERDRIYGLAPDGRRVDVYTTAPTFVQAHMDALSPYVSVHMAEPFAVSTRPVSLPEARALLSQNRSALLSHIEATYGPHAETYKAMSCCLSWDTIYESESGRLCSTVSRIWNQGWGGYVLFDWDTFFAAAMASLDGPELAWLNAIAIVDEATEAGFIPNFAANNDYKSRDRSQPPVGALVAMGIYQRHGGEWFLQRVYPTLLRQNEWFAAHRTLPDGSMAWGSNRYEPITGRYWESHNTGCRYGASLESGLDNAPMYDDARFDPESELLLLSDVGLMGLYIQDCESLIAMARVLGHAADIPALEARKQAVSAALDALWSEENGMYLNRDLTTGQPSLRVAPTHFYALFDPAVPRDRQQRMLDEWFYAPDKFGGDYILPATTRDDPAYGDNDYWRGRIWAPLNYLVYLALCKAGQDEAAGVLAEKSEKLLLQEWLKNGHVHENYNAENGQGNDVPNSDAFYHWGGLLGLIALEHARRQP